MKPLRKRATIKASPRPTNMGEAPRWLTNSSLACRPPMVPPFYGVGTSPAAAAVVENLSTGASQGPEIESTSATTAVEASRCSQELENVQATTRRDPFPPSASGRTRRQSRHELRPAQPRTALAPPQRRHHRPNTGAGLQDSAPTRSTSPARGTRVRDLKLFLDYADAAPALLPQRPPRVGRTIPSSRSCRRPPPRCCYEVHPTSAAPATGRSRGRSVRAGVTCSDRVRWRDYHRAATARTATSSPTLLEVSAEAHRIRSPTEARPDKEMEKLLHG
jgi:hypothetical protein